jgi:hypothetical protein
VRLVHGCRVETCEDPICMPVKGVPLYGGCESESLQMQMTTIDMAKPVSRQRAAALGSNGQIPVSWTISITMRVAGPQHQRTESNLICICALCVCSSRL